MFIRDQRPRLSDLASVWMAGVALVVLITGVIGVTQPLRRDIPIISSPDHESAGVMIEAFEPAPLPDAQAQPDQPDAPRPPDVEIPPPPQIVPPLEPPAMIEITPLAEPPPTPAIPARLKPPPTPQAARQRSPDGGAPQSLAAGPTASNAPGSGTSGRNTSKGSGSNRGRFPPPAYPSSARSRKEQGTVKLMVTVEPSGLPSAVEIQSSSGSATLDNAAKDHVSRRWRWPASQLVRRIVVPVRFQLE